MKDCPSFGHDAVGHEAAGVALKREKTTRGKGSVLPRRITDRTSEGQRSRAPSGIL